MSLKYSMKESFMHSTVAISAYQNIKNKVRSDEAVGYDVIRAALKKLEINLHSLSTANDLKDSSKAFENALVGIYFLQKGLDFNGGGDLAKHLFRLYEFCRLKVLENGVVGSRGNPDIIKCHAFIKDIGQSWEQAKNS